MRKVVEKHNVEFMEALLKSKHLIDIHKNVGFYYKKTPLEQAVENVDYRMISLLLDYGTDVMKILWRRSSSSLNLVAKSQNPRMWEIFIDKMSDINQADYQENTFLHLAVMKENIPLVKLLLKNQADSSLKNEDGDTPLDIAKSKKNLELEQLFKAKG